MPHGLAPRVLTGNSDVPLSHTPIHIAMIYCQLRLDRNRKDRLYVSDSLSVIGIYNKTGICKWYELAGFMCLYYSDFAGGYNVYNYYIYIYLVNIIYIYIYLHTHIYSITHDMG